MPLTPDRHPGECSEEGTVYDNLSSGQDPTVAGGFRYVNGNFSLRDSIGLFNPRLSTFGSNWNTASSDVQADTSLTSFQQKHRLTPSTLVSGTYIIVWSCELRASSANREVYLQAMLDGATVIALGDYRPTQANLWLPVSGIYTTSLSASTHTVDLNWCAAVTSYAASIRRARIALWRVV